MHDGGDRLVMHINGKLACNSTAHYTNEILTTMKECVEPIKVTRGDKIHLEAFFDHEKHPP
jgi:hypothetical protein